MPKLFAERAFRTVYNSRKSFRAYVRLRRNTDAAFVYLQYGGVCRMTSLSLHVYRAEKI